MQSFLPLTSCGQHSLFDDYDYQVFAPDTVLYTSEFAHGRNLGSKKGVVFLEEFCRSVS